MELADLIRLNQLVRRTIDFDGFENWFQELSPNDRRTLVFTLSEFAQQAGVDNEVLESAVAYADWSSDHPSLKHVQALRQDNAMAIRLYDWIQGLSDTQLHEHLRFFVALFGTAERRVFSNEREEWCEWTSFASTGGDVLDDRVVQDLLKNPKFYRTSMKDDAKIKIAE